MYTRAVEKEIDHYLTDSDTSLFFLWGPRRSGKTTILNKLSSTLSLPIFNFDLLSDAALFLPQKQTLEKIAKEHRIILIDEVQSAPETTVALKLLHDLWQVKIIATGSSELRQKGNQQFDTLAGRYTEHFCLPLGIEEIAQYEQGKAYNAPEQQSVMLRFMQIYGSYPEVYANTNSSDTAKIALLQNILDTYVLKDIINLYDLKNAKLAKDILTKIALQIGSEVSLREIATSLQANVTTVSNYIEIFIKNYILIPLPSFKTNMRKAVSENRKLFFYDLGIRNILVKDFRDLKLRPDKGGVFENYIVSEMEKRRKTHNFHTSLYFYRQYGGQEVDIIMEDYIKKYMAVEINTKRRKRKDIFPLAHSFTTINEENYFTQIMALLPNESK